MSIVFGEIPGYPEGSWFDSQYSSYKAGVHGHNVKGICGTPSDGASSIVLSDSYDNKDYGNTIVYTGEGGWDDNTKSQIADQELTGHNKALLKSLVAGLPVRVIRGFKHKSPYSPSTGYRYDGLYIIEGYWKEKLNSHIVWKFKLTKLNGETLDFDTTENPIVQKATKRRETFTYRIIRDTKKCQAVKKMYDYRCQVCDWRLEGPDGPYAEGAHIKPLGEPHNGPDSIANIICLCPNHHKLFDIKAFSIRSDLELVGIKGRLIVKLGHHLDPDCLAYRNNNY